MRGRTVPRLLAASLSVTVAVLATSAAAGSSTGVRSAAALSPATASLFTPQFTQGRLAAPVVGVATGYSTRPLRELAAAPAPAPSNSTDREAASREVGERSSGDAPSADGTVQRGPTAISMPAPSRSFDGLNNLDNLNTLGIRVRPPDTDGDVGPHHYVEYINLVGQVYSKSGVPQLSRPFTANMLFSGLPAGHFCRSDAGDPITSYDQFADRWVLTQFAYNPATGFGPYYECIAVSQTPDPTGPYCNYAVLTSNNVFPDYPKFGVWRDGYYFSAIGFPDDPSLPAYPVAFAVERDRMITPGCHDARYVYFDRTNSALNPGMERILPSDIDGPSLSHFREPNYYYTHVDDPANVNDRLEQWEFSVDWTNPANSTFLKDSDIRVAPFDMTFDCPVHFRQCIPQRGTDNRLDIFINPGRGRLMQEVNYRSFGGHPSIVLTHSVDAGTNHAGIRWYELRNPEGTPTVYQQSTYAPDAHHRWMQSIAMDGRGDIAIGYSVSSATLYPSLRYAGRLVSDPLNQLAQGEASLHEGTGSQLLTFSGSVPQYSASGRWGDYSRLTVDPVDDCTFWYVGEYYPVSDGRNWHTRIGSFAFPQCGGAPPPHAATVGSFVSHWTHGHGVAATWRTTTEADAAGFNIYRSTGSGVFRKLNFTLIPAKRTGSLRGASYRFVDRTAVPGRAYTYRLQIVDRTGKRSWYSIGSAATR